MPAGGYKFEKAIATDYKKEWRQLDTKEFQGVTVSKSLHLLLSSPARPVANSLHFYEFSPLF
jgi:hypothetical protein